MFFFLFVNFLTVLSVYETEHFYIIDTQQENWYNASKYCAETYGTTLGRVRDSSYDDEISYYYRYSGTPIANFWLGGTDENEEGKWVWPDNDQFWSGGAGGEAISGVYENWLKWGEPNDLNGEDCLLSTILGGSITSIWNDGNCNHLHYFICSKEHILLVNEELNYASARTYCNEEFGTDLAIINSQDLDNEAMTLLDMENLSPGYTFIGGNSFSNPNIWKWLDGTSFYNTTSNTAINGAYNNFQNNEPSGGEECLEIRRNYWNDISCNGLQPFFCSVVPFPTPNPTTNPTPDLCDCTNPVVCEANSPFSYASNNCGANLPDWEATIQCEDGSVASAYGRCGCTQGYPNSDSNPEDVCIKNPWEYDDNLCECLQTCTPGETQCPEDHYCVDTCCPSLTGESTYRCMPCCDSDFNAPTPEPTTSSPTTPEPTTPQPTSDLCDCNEPVVCEANSPFSYGNQCATNLPFWEEGINCLDGSVAIAYGHCACTQGYANLDISLEDVCIKNPWEYDDNLCECLQTCIPGETQCPEDHYCVDTCCPSLTGEPSYRCMPCCDADFNAPTPEPTTPVPTTPSPTTPQPTSDLCDCNNPVICQANSPFSYASNNCGTNLPDWETTIQCEDGSVANAYGRCGCTQGYPNSDLNLEDVCIKNPWEYDDNLCECLQTCIPGETQCPEDHYCVDTCCPSLTGESTYRCMPCCDADF